MLHWFSREKVKHFADKPGIGGYVPDKMAKIVRTSIRMDARLHERASDFVHAMKKRRKKVSMDWLVQHAIDCWLQGNDPQTSDIPAPQFELQEDPRLAPWVEMLKDILRSNHQIAIDAITRNLQAFRELTTSPRKAGSAAVVLTPDELIRWSEQAIKEYRNSVAATEKIAG